MMSSTTEFAKVFSMIDFVC